MTTAAERLEHVQLKLKRAKEHIADLEREIVAFVKRNPNPYACVFKRNPDPSKSGAYYMTRVDPTPKCLPLIAGDAIQNLMGALDHLAYEIVCSDTGDKPPRPSKIYFPIANSVPEYTKAFKDRKICGAVKDSIDAIDALEPYKGGKGNDLWVLHTLNNVDKHRFLILVGSAFRSVNIGAYASRSMSKLIGKELPVLNAFFMGADAQFPLKVGDEIFSFAAGVEPDEHMEFRFDVALCQPQVIEAKSVSEALHQLMTLVEGIVVALTPRLRDAP